MNKKKPYNKAFYLKILGRLALFTVVFFVALILFVRSQWGQDIIVSKATSYISTKTNTKVEIEKLYITFSGNILLKGLYLEDKKGDTLIFSKKLESSIAIMPLIKGTAFNLKSLEWEGVKVNVHRKDSITKFNYDFLIDALVSQDTSAVKEDSKPMQIALGKIHLKDFEVGYNDAVMGIESGIKFNAFDIEANDLDLETNTFNIDEISLNDALISYHQTKSLPESTDETTSKLPFISIGNIDVKKSNISYKSDPDDLNMNVYLDDFSLELPLLDLTKQELEIAEINLKQSKIKFEQIKTVVEESTVESKAFEWPSWTVSITNMDFENNQIAAKTGNTISEEKVFNAEDIQLSTFNFKANNIAYKPQSILGSITEISFEERSGFQLENLATQLQVGNTSLGLNKLAIATKFNSINGAVNLKYDSFNAFLNTPDKSRVSSQLSILKMNASDAFFFSPQLKNNEALVAFSQKNITGNVNIEGEINNFTIAKTNLNWGANTRLTLGGTVANVLETENLNLNIQQIDFATTKEDATAFINSKELGVDVPETLRLQGNIKGKLDDFKTNLNLSTTQGTINLKVNLKNTNTMAFDGVIDVEKLELGKILNNDQLGTYSFTTRINGNGTDLNTLDAAITSDFRKLEYNNYDFSNLKLNGEITNGNGDISLNFKDANLDVDFLTTVKLDSVASKFQSVLDVHGVNFKALGVSEEDTRAKFKVVLDITGNDATNISLDGKISEVVAVKNKKPYILGDVSFEGVLNEKNTSFNIASNPVTASLIANADVTSLATAMQEQFQNYFNDVPISEEKDNTSAVTMQFNGTIQQAPIFKDLFFSELETLEPVEIRIDFNERLNTLSSKINAPHMVYGGNRIDSLNIVLEAEKDKLDFNFNVGNLSAGSLAVKKIALTGNLKEKVLISDFKAMNSDETLLHIASETKKSGDTISVHINPKDLILNKLQWTMLSENKIVMASDFLSVEDFSLYNGDQKITISTSLPNQTKSHIGFQFNEFKLSTLTTLFNQEKRIVAGSLNGEVVIENPFAETGIVANASVFNLRAMEIPLGNLTLSAKSLENAAYNLNLAIAGDNLNIDIGGTYEADPIAAVLDFNIDLKSLNLKAMEPIMSTYVSNTSGSLSGNVKVTGTTSAPEFLGGIHFNGSNATINALNAAFTFPKETIRLDNTGVYFDNFKMLDINKNPFILNGKVNTETLTNPEFALTLKSKNIEVLNSSKADNDLFYGKVNLDTDITIGGNLDLPIVSGDLMINEASNFTYIIPEDQVDIVEKEGVVLFVNKKNPDDILTRQTDSLTSSGVLKGYDIDVQLRIAKKAVFTIVIDERSGDNLSVSGAGNFNFGISKNGDMSLSGKYEVADGHYEVSLYNLIKKRFDIADGSNIVWRGNPLEADMDIRAIYEVETSASGLMASQLTGESASNSEKFRQKLPFLVYLNLDGELLKPEISFNLDIPEDKQGELGGAVYSQVQQLNTQEEELNKQVFSLLVLNQFFPSSSTDGSSGGSLSIARDNVNNVLSDQLNNFSNKLLGNSGIELDFGIDSYVDYQGDAPSNKTELKVNAKKRLFNDKLIVEVGSGVDVQEDSQNAGETTPLVGTVNIQYLFDDNGRWRLKAYRKNEFESVIDGQIILTGIALIFNQEFNKFQELFAKAVEEEVSNKKKETQPIKEHTEQ
ncbi:translocation/assembly module TamB domain-containing protein [Algibacter miyuki]|uniref:Translocation/assembly module TamB domain-containing protein n=1 Tax=Algibacter miyuki TaxID=1306933 RepID=A0ABV5H0C3_9FLAO|nr:translocation/assembly module TamB domain-containing protein [Algibacter miyuki]MDN3667416.1 translocation/assembly module TamB domain-containing protein [Algibacter miyuki]